MDQAIECSYVGCGKTLKKGQRFHYFPYHNAGLCVKWLINSGREDLLTCQSLVLESMSLAICGDHFQDDDYNSRGALKKGRAPLQYWDLGYPCELGEIKVANMDQQLHDIDQTSLTSSDSEESSDDEFRTRLGNQIEALLNSFQSLRDKSQHKSKPYIGQSLKTFYQKFDNKVDRDKDENEVTRIGSLTEFKRVTINMCRTCAKKKTNLVDIADKPDNCDVDIITKLKLLIEIKEHDVLPKKICSECLTKLKDSYEFFQQIYEADSTLRDMLLIHNKRTECFSKKRKYNGQSAHSCDAKNKNQLFNKRNDFSSKVNNMPFKNRLKSTEITKSYDTMDDSYNSDNFQESSCKSNDVQDESRVLGKIYASDTSENTVSYILSESCDNDEELSWLDVVGAMKTERRVNASTSDATLEKLPDSKLRISCQYCDSSFRLRRQLKSHIKLDHHRSKNYNCNHCDVHYKSKDDLSQHQIQAHSRKRYKCNECEEMFYKKGNLRIHIQKSHSANKNIFPDIKERSTCTETVSKTEIKAHKIPSLGKTFSCNDCKNIFSSKHTLYRHIHRLHPPFAYTCTICNKVMYSEADTHKHMTIHDKSPLFPCLDCGRMFYSTEQLDKHKNAHAEGTLKKRKRIWFHCQLCDESYVVADELIKHIETHTSEDWEKYRNKILYCGECSTRIIGDEKFRIHKMKYHLGERGDFICLFCGDFAKNFTSSQEYARHISQHSNELKELTPRKYKCAYCDKAFRSNSHLINHQDSFHSNITVGSSPECIQQVKRAKNSKDQTDELRNSKDDEDTRKEPVRNFDKLVPWDQNSNPNGEH